MEEAEALSKKMGIMVHGGVFKCFGSSTHIKEKYGTSYIIEFKIMQPTLDQLMELAQVSGTQLNSNSNFDKNEWTKLMKQVSLSQAKEIIDTCME